MAENKAAPSVAQQQDLRPQVRAVVELPPDFVTSFPDAPDRQTTPPTDMIGAEKWHRDAIMRWYATGGAGPPPI
jgi:hypothetical protein